VDAEGKVDGSQRDKDAGAKFLNIIVCHRVPQDIRRKSKEDLSL
jgi:hypothetical protein